MDKLFHANDKNIKDFKLQVPKPIRALNKHVGGGDNNFNAVGDNLLDSKLMENNLAKLLNKKLSLDDYNKKKSVPTLASKKTNFKKITRSSVDVNQLKDNRGDSKDKMNSKSDDKRKIKSYSSEEIVSESSSKKTDCNVKCKSQGVQTIDTNDLDSLYSEGVIR